MILILETITDKKLFDLIESIASILGNFGIFFITAYGFWLSFFSKNIKVTSIGENLSRFFGNYINCTIMNKTLSPIVINEIKAVYDNKYEVTVKKFADEPLVIEPFRACNITGDQYSSLSEEFSKFGNVYFKLLTPEKTLFIKYKGKIKKKAKLEIVMHNVNRFDDVVLSEQVKYVLVYWYKGEKELHKIYITKDGVMDKNLKDFNALPQNILGKPEVMVEVFKNTFNNENWCFQINEIGQK